MTDRHGVKYTTEGTVGTVLDPWHEYHNHLGTKFDDAAFVVWNAKGDELFVNLLFAIATDVRFKFHRVQLKTGAYSPIAHGDLEHEPTLIRKPVLNCSRGRLLSRWMSRACRSTRMHQEATMWPVGRREAILRLSHVGANRTELSRRRAL